MLLNVQKESFVFILVYLFFATTLYFFVPKPQGHYDVDSYGYDPIAWHFAQTGTLTDPNSVNSAPIQPVGYPFVMGVLFTLFGHTITPIIIVQILLMSCALLLLMHIASTFFNKMIAAITAFCFLGTIGFYVYPQLILAETLLLVVLLLFVERYLTFLKTHDSSALCFSGLFLGISMLIKPVAMLFVVCLSIITFFAMHHSKIKNILLLLFSFFLPLTMYMTRNYVQYGCFAFAPTAQVNLYQVLLAKVIGSVEQKDPQEIIETELRFAGKHSLDDQGWQPAKKIFYTYLKKHPFTFVRIWFVNVCKTWLGLYSTQLKRLLEPERHKMAHSFFVQSGSLTQRIHHYIMGGTSHKWVENITWFELIWSIIRLLLTIVGLYVVFKMNSLIGWFFVVMMISLSFPTGIDGCCRYRIVFEPILMLLTSVGIWKIVVCYITKKKEHWYGISW